MGSRLTRLTRCSASGSRIPHPFTPQDRAAGYRYDISILQAEFSLTQVLDRPTTGRVFFEEVIRENLDIGPGPAHTFPGFSGFSTNNKNINSKIAVIKMFNTITVV